MVSFYAHSVEKPLYSRLDTKRSSVRAGAGWLIGLAIRSGSTARPITLWFATIAAVPFRATGTRIGNTVAGPAMISIESEESNMMSKADRKEIERMRMDGYGPTHIANELGLSVNTVKSHIRRHPSLKNAVYCLQCGRAVSQTPGRKQKRFCSNTCRSRYWNYQYRKGGRDGKAK